jgi:hypothetical protein
MLPDQPNAPDPVHPLFRVADRFQPLAERKQQAFRYSRLARP